MLLTVDLVVLVRVVSICVLVTVGAIVPTHAVLIAPIVVNPIVNPPTAII